MTFERFVKKNMKRITRLETELDKLFDGTSIYTSIDVEQHARRSRHDRDAEFSISAYAEVPGKSYFLKNFANMTAMIGQIKHDVKEARK